MKHLILIVSASVRQDLADQLRALKGVHGFTLSHAEGHGNEAGFKPLLSAYDQVVGYVPQVRVDILLEAADVDSVIGTLSTPAYGLTGQGVYWVTAVEKKGCL